MHKLGEIQSHFRNAVIQPDSNVVTTLALLLTGGDAPEKRLAIHQRNYRHSLVEALLVKFPATAWLMGTSFLFAAAERFVCEHPPAAPCIAEYGSDFSAFLSRWRGAERAPYLRDFVELEWCVGQVAIAVDGPALESEHFSRLDPDVLPSLYLALQPGLYFLQPRWPVDELMTLYLSDTAPDRLDLSPADVWIQIRGARGQFHITRLGRAEFMFRKSIADGRSIGDAAESALDLDADLDPGQALASLISSGLVAGVAKHSVEIV
jgi:Putative DNA-binding domain